MTSLSGSASPADAAPLPPLSFGQRRLWALSQREGASAAYNEPMAFRLRGPLDRTVLGRALDALTARHEALRTRLVPYRGDAYQQVDMYLAHDMLSPALRGMLDGLTAVHDGGLSLKGYTLPPDYVAPVSEHPLVVRHPETDRRVLYVNPAYTDRIPQLSADESRAVLDLLFKVVAERPLLFCRVRWEPDTLVFWDNRCVQHHAVYDYYPHTRYGRRVAINGGPLKG